ncbi:hypothetical protein WJX73_008918, partial [Symbiochloris irregularis]
STLEQLALQTLVTWKDFIGSIGELSQHLLEPLFRNCTPVQLAHFEDQARLEGRVQSLDLDHHWQHCFAVEFGAPARPPLGGHWRQAYENHVEFLARKRARSGQRLKQLWQDAADQKSDRTLKVIDARPAKRMRGHHTSPSIHRTPAGSQAGLIREWVSML